MDGRIGYSETMVEPTDAGEQASASLATRLHCAQEHTSNRLSADPQHIKHQLEITHVA
jgi:hypothetical protein